MGRAAGFCSPLGAPRFFDMWLRLHTDILNNRKVQKLPPELFKGWINLLCLTKEHGGILPEIADIAFRLRIEDSQAEGLIEILTQKGLLDRHSDGLRPHNWGDRQYEGDSSAERMRRHRQKKRDGAVTGSDGQSDVTVTVQSRGRAEADSEAETDSEAAAEQRRSSGVLPAAAASDFNEIHSSAFAFAEVEDFVRATKPHIKNPGGLARILWRSGKEDGAIGQWLIEREERRGRIRETAPDYTMEGWVDESIANGFDDQLKTEMERINKRGGPTLDWEWKICDYFNSQAAEGAAQGGDGHVDF